MATITEEMAVKAYRAAKAFPDDAEVQEKARAIAATYRKQQETLGKPLFAKTEKARADQFEASRKMFQDRETHGLDPDTLAEFNRVLRDRPEEKFEVINSRFLRQATGLPKEQVSAMRPDLLAAWSKKHFGEEIRDDRAFYDRLGSEFDFEDAVSERATAAALTGMRNLDAIGKLSEENAENPLFKGRESKWQDTFLERSATVRGKLAPYEPLVNSIVSQLQEKTGVTETAEEPGSYRELAADLIELPEQERDLVIAAVIARGSSEGDRKSYAKKLAENFGRGLVDYSEGVPNFTERGAALFFRNQLSLGIPVPAAAANDPEAYLQAANVRLAERVSGPAAIQEGLSRMASGEELVMPSDEVKALALAKIDRLVEGIDLRAKIRQIAENDIDPATHANTALRGFLQAARSLPYTGVAMLPGGAVLNSVAMSENSYQALRAANPDMTAEQAHLIAGFAGPAQAGLEQISAAILTGKLPTLARWKNKVTATKGAAGFRFGQRAVGATGMEFVQENLQDVTPFAFQSAFSALSEDVPGVDWEARFGEMAKTQGELFWAVLPLALMGAGVGTARDYRGAHRLMKSPELLKAAGINEAAASEVLAKALAGDFEGAQADLRRAFLEGGQDQKEVAAVINEAIPRLVEERQQIAKAIEAGQDLDLIPGIVNEGEGMWSLRFEDGSGVSFNSFGEAQARLDQSLSDSVLRLHSSVISTIRTVSGGIEAGRGLKYLISPEAPTVGDRQATGELDADTAAEVVTIADTLSPEIQREFDEASTMANLAASSPEERQALARIIGESANDYREGIVWTTMKLYQGFTAATVLEEKFEGDAKFMLNQGGIPRKWMVGALRDWERITGDKLLLSEDDEQVTDRNLVEAWSKMGISYFVGKAGEGKGKAEPLNLTQTRKLLESSLAGALTGYAGLFQGILKRAAMIEKAKAEGTIDADLVDFLDRATGLSEQGSFEKAVRKEGEGIAANLAEDSRSLGEDDNGQPVTREEVGATFSVIPSDGNLENVFVKMFSPFHRSPELRSRLGEEMKRRVLEIEKTLRPILRANRTKKSIEAERKAREETLFGEKLDSLGSSYLSALDVAQMDDVSARPILSEMLRRKTYQRKDGKVVAYWSGILMSKAEAKRRGMDTSKGEWDDIPEGLPGYLWGGTLTPDQAAADRGFDSIPEFWDAISREVNSWKARQAEYENASREVSRLRKEAREESRAWAEQALRDRETVGSDRQTLLGFLRTLDAITRALPPEVRGKIGGYVALARLTTPGAMLDEIEYRVDRVQEELEKWLKDQAEIRRRKLFKKAEPKRDASGKVPKGKAGADIHELFSKLREALLWDGDTAEIWAAGLEAKALSGDLTAEEEAHALNEASLVRLFADWKNADAARRTAAVEAAEDIFRTGYMAERERVAKERERREAARAEIRQGIGTLGDRKGRMKKAKEDAGFAGKFKENVLMFFNFAQVAGFTLGENSKWARWFADREREASNAFTDEVHEVTSDLEAFMVELAGSPLKAEKLQWKLSQRSFSTEKGGLMSELEGITALLMWRQEDGRRHMRGRRDENGVITSTWAYDEAFIQEVEANLSPEALKIMDYLAENYAGEWETLNPVFREINGINLPRHDHYSPLTVKGQQEQAGQMENPLTGNTMTAGSRSPGSLKTRAQVVAEPDFRNAVEVFIGHKKQLAHWKAYARLNIDAQAVLRNREVQNSIIEKNGEEAAKVLKGWLDYFAQGGFREAAAHFEQSKLFQRVLSRAAAMQLVGRVGTLLVQTTQLAAGMAKMPLNAYALRLSKLLTGNLSWKEALDSPYIQRRLQVMPPAVQVAMEGLRSGKPNEVKHAARALGKLIAGTDALMTAGTFAIVRDYQLTQLRKAGVTGPEAEAIALAETERIVDEIAQPTRPGTRSLKELTSGTFWRMVWPFASEARKNLALIVYSGMNRSKTEAARAILGMWLVNSMIAGVIRTAWRDLRDDDDEEVFDPETWNVSRLLLQALSEPLYGFPVFGEAVQEAIFAAAGEWKPTGGLVDLKRAPGAAGRLLTGDFDKALQDVETLLMVGGLGSETIAGAASFMHLIRDADKIRQNFTN